MCDDLTDRDMAPEMDADPAAALASCIRRKRPDGWAVHWGQRRVRILEFTRCNDYRPDWREETEAYKTGLYQPLRDRMLAALPNGWSVDIINFTLGIRGSFAETQWTVALTALGVPPAATRVTHLMSQCSNLQPPLPLLLVTLAAPYSCDNATARPGTAR
jgi:hypothetical protein